MRLRRRSDTGFTLTELLVAITILGIIMGAIGAMITTAFRTSSTVSSELSGSRGPKVVSRYWVPDVEQAAVVQDGGGCGSGSPVVTFTSLEFGTTVDAPDQPADAGSQRVITWAETAFGSRDQLVRYTCVGGSLTDTTVVVADLDGTPKVDVPVVPDRKAVIHVTVPDHSAQSKQYEFEVAATQQVTPEPAP
ncbi:MAG: PulJ/GspJ family protein [Acidimicrobiia bacterium]